MMSEEDILDELSAILERVNWIHGTALSDVESEVDFVAGKINDLITNIQKGEVKND